MCWRCSLSNQGSLDACGVEVNSGRAEDMLGADIDTTSLDMSIVQYLLHLST